MTIVAEVEIVAALFDEEVGFRGTAPARIIGWGRGGGYREGEECEEESDPDQSAALGQRRPATGASSCGGAMFGTGMVMDRVFFPSVA